MHEPRTGTRKVPKQLPLCTRLAPVSWTFPTSNYQPKPRCSCVAHCHSCRSHARRSWTKESQASRSTTKCLAQTCGHKTLTHKRPKCCCLAHIGRGSGQTEYS